MYRFFHNQNFFTKGYSARIFKSDFSAGLLLAIVVIPQAMAYSLLAGLPPVHGLYAAMVGSVIYALGGTSKHLEVGPTAIEAMLTASAISLVVPEGLSVLSTLALITITIGGIQLLIGLFRWGFLVDFISSPVLSGFTSGVAILIIINQIKHIFNVPLENCRTVTGFFRQIELLGTSHSFTVLISFISIGLLILSRVRKMKFPLPIVIVFAGLILSFLLDWEGRGVKVLGDIPSGLPSFVIPVFSFDKWIEILRISATIALISLITASANAKRIRTKDKSYDLDADQDIKTLGLANIVGSFLSCFPVSGSFSRTVINFEFGAQTQASNLVKSFFIFLVLCFFSSYFYALPISILSAFIIVSIWGIIDAQKAKDLFYKNYNDFCLLMIAFLSTLLFGVTSGIVVGIILSIGSVIIRSSQPHIAILERVTGTNYFRNINRFEDTDKSPKTLMVRVDHHLYYLNANYFKGYVLRNLKERTLTEKLIIHAGGVASVDSTAMEVIEEILEFCTKRNIRMCFSNCVGPVRDAFDNYGLFDSIGKENFFLNIKDAYECEDFQNISSIAIQSNSKNKKPK